MASRSVSFPEPTWGSSARKLTVDALRMRSLCQRGATGWDRWGRRLGWPSVGGGSGSHILF